MLELQIEDEKVSLFCSRKRSRGRTNWQQWLQAAVYIQIFPKTKKFKIDSVLPSLWAVSG